jgi:hypothetical protein
MIQSPLIEKNEVPDLKDLQLNQKRQTNAAAKPVEIELNERETEEYIQASATQENISDRFVPVLLYYIKSLTNIHFGASGTMFLGKSSGVNIVTAEHVFSTNAPYGDCSIGVCMLRPREKDIATIVDKVIVASQGFGGEDIAIASLKEFKNELNVITNFAALRPKTSMMGMIDHFTLANGKKICRLQSLVSGKWHDVIGTETLRNNTNALAVIGICINRNTLRGESGCGFQDEDKNLYTACFIEDTHSPKWPDLSATIKAHYKGQLEGVTTVYGPLTLVR